MTTKSTEAARLLGRKGGKARAANTTAKQREEWSRKGAEAANANATPEERSERARVAAAARWSKRKKGETRATVFIYAGCRAQPADAAVRGLTG